MSAVRPGLVRLLSVLVALVAIWGLFFFEPSSPRVRAELLELKLGFAGMLIASLGMLVPWGRWFQLVSPGEDLGQAAQAIGWIGAGALPFSLATGRLVVAVFCVLATASALATWKGRAWAAWGWYTLAATISLYGGVTAVLQFLDAGGRAADVRQLLGEATIACLCWYWFLREVELWRRRVQSQDASPASQPPH